MSLFDHLRGLVHGFVLNRVRSLLTLLGIVIGSGSIVMLAGLLHGAEESLLRLNQGIHDSDVVKVNKEEPPQKQLERTRRELSRDDAHALQTSPQLFGADVAIEARNESMAWYQGRQKRVRLVGGTERTLPMYRLAMAKGRFVDAADVREGKRVAAVGYEIWKELLEEHPDPLGMQLKVDDQSWTIIGIIEHRPTMSHGDGTWLWDRKMVVPQTAFDAVLTPEHRVDSIFLKARGAGVGERAVKVIASVTEQILLRRHLGVQNFKVGDREGSGQERLIISIIEILLLGTGLMSMFVGGINIMNIMLVTVTERTREIGIRRAIGAPPSAILTQFVLEAGAVSLLGGLLGVLGGIAFSWAAAFGLGKAFGGWPFHVELWSVGLALGLALLTGVLFGLFPAWRAARLDPVEALRYE